ncbi:TIGR02147 family protein [Bdellovibrio sp. HCB2-146]|uniref:TIGR02147 family protein n=1 Tax=Bdellovibrio sp. HCB2-146 TaxID=3394362 RepID=UPI0039BC777F
METTVKNLLIEELAKRQMRNSAYSIRAFARDLGVGVTTLSDVLAGRRSLSKTNVQKVMEKLSVSPLEREVLWAHYKATAARTEIDDRTTLDEDTFRLIADWHYLAIMNLAKLKTNSAKPEWIAERLNIRVDDAEVALERLFRLELIKKTRGNRLERTAKPLTTSNEIPSAAIRKHHSQNLRLAEESLHRDPVPTREFGSVTMAINPEKLPQAKEILLKTRKKIAGLLEEGDLSEVYTLSFQLFPLTKLQTSSED